MSFCRILASAAVVATAAGCGGNLAGTYRGDARVMEGRQETETPGYTLDEIRKKIADDGRTLTLEPGGRFRWKSDNTTVEGEWRVEGNTLFALDDTANGETIQKGLRVEREFTLRDNGELIQGTSYNLYNLEEFYTKQE